MSSRNLTELSLLVLFIFSLSSGSPPSDLDKPYKFVLPRGEKQERELSFCEENAPCSIVQNPFFFPFIVKRLCRCKNKECPDTYEAKKSLDTVFINNREQMKFCDDLPRCPKGILRVGFEDNLPVHLNCFCPRRRYWRRILPEEILLDAATAGSQPKQQDAGNLAYSCEKLERCRKTCGTLRPDLYATYQNCTCPVGHLCLPELKMDIIDVPLYTGPGFISTCTLLPEQ